MNTVSIKLGKRLVTRETAPYFIAEIGVNHEGDISKAKLMIDLAAKAGADAVKFQTYKAETLTVVNSPAYWDTSHEPTDSQYKLFKKFDRFGISEYSSLCEYSRSIGVDFLSTPFDLDSVGFLDSMVPFFKIASADITNYQLLREVASTHKPVILSTGAATYAEICEAINVIGKISSTNVALLHCVLKYPTPVDEASLIGIKYLLNSFQNNVIGYSDHTVPTEDALALTTAVNFGATIIEKHFTYDRSLPGNDHYHAIDCEGLSSLTEKFKRIQRLSGTASVFDDRSSESCARQYARRGLYYACNISSGTRLTEKHIISKRPVGDMPANMIDQIVGRILLRDVAADMGLNFSDFKNENS